MIGIKEMFDRCEQIGCLAFSTNAEDGHVATRIAHFIAWDDEGLYFTTMHTKPFYRELLSSGKVSVCGMFPKTYVEYDDEGLPYFVPGYTIRLEGDARELTGDEIAEKAKVNDGFRVAVHDIKKYPATRAFIMYRARGEIYDYDYEKENRDHKVERERFAFGGMTFVPPGFTITDDCIGCGTCMENCTFDAIEEGTPYRINGRRCDECGTCVHVCPVGAVLHKGI